MPSTALILIANGTEEMEFTIPYDTFVRAGIAVTSAFVSAPSEVDPNTPGGQEITGTIATCSRGMKIIADTTLEEIQKTQQNSYDVVVIPGGGKGADTLSQSPGVQELVSKQIMSRKLVGMICAGSLAAKTSKLPKQPLTSHPSVKDQLEGDFEYKEESVVTSNNLVTSRGPGTAFPFAFEIVRLLCGELKAREVKGPMVFPPNTY